MAQEQPKRSLDDAPHEIARATASMLDARARAGALTLDPDTPGALVCSSITRATDSWLSTLWRAAAPDLVPRSSIWALGGYGRQELSFFSDLDLLILFDDDLASSPHAHSQVERFMRWVRLTRLELRHAVRTPAQMVSALSEDHRTPISMLDARLVSRGQDAHAHAHPRDLALPHLRAQDEGRAFSQLLLDGMRARHERAGATVYMLEPQLKTGVGGLRDLHALRWASLARFGLSPERLERAPAWSPHSTLSYTRSLDWLLRARHALHHALGRKHDRLRFPEQELLAHRLTGTPDTPTSARVESFMREHYRQARAAERLARRALLAWRQPALRPRPTPLGAHLHELDGTLGASTDGGFVPSLSNTLDAITLAHRLDLSLDPDLEHSLHEAQPRWRDDLSVEPELAARVGALLTDVHAPPERSHTLLELGVLTAAIPELSPLVCHVHHDTFHVYTTDEHSLRCLERGRALLSARPDPVGDRWPPLREMASRAPHDLLLLACLLHDVGKNRGGDHSRVGADLVPDISRRLGLPPALSDSLSFLVLEHLSLSLAAKRHDITSQEVLDPLAARIGDVATLEALTLLTFCDSSTIAPEGIGDWDASLLLQLHHALRRRLEQDASHHAALALAARSSEAFHALEPARAARTLALFEDLVLDSSTPIQEPGTLARQFDLFTRWLDTRTPQTHATPLPARGYIEVIVCSPSHTHTLSSLSGAFGAQGLQILSARMSVDPRRTFLGVFHLARQTAHHFARVPSHQRTVPDQASALAIAAVALAALDASPLEIAERVGARLAEPRSRRPRGPAIDVRVTVTRRGRTGALAEVRAPDRLALFYDLCRALDTLDARICFAKLDAHGHRVLDNLYLEPTSSARFSRAQLDALRDALTRAATPHDNDLPNLPRSTT